MLLGLNDTHPDQSDRPNKPWLSLDPAKKLSDGLSFYQSNLISDSL